MAKHSIAPKIGMTLSVAAALGSMIVAPLPAAAQSKGIGGLFACEGSGKKQEGGALIGAAAGALLGRAVAKNEKTLGTVVGAAAGAAAGAYIGCRMQSTDQALAQQATKRALESGRSESWSNSHTGASGRIDVVSSSYGPPIDGQNLRFERGVLQLRSYDAVAGGDYSARGAANLRSSPSTTGKVVGKLAAGERVEVLGGAPNSNWLLVGRNGYGVGYVSASLLDQGGYAQASCRIINASISTKGAAPSSERYSACKDGKGEWQLTTV